MANLTKVGSSGGNYEILGIDWKAKKLGVPIWGWGAGLIGAWLLFFRKGRR